MFVLFESCLWFFYTKMGHNLCFLCQNTVTLWLWSKTACQTIINIISPICRLLCQLRKIDVLFLSISHWGNWVSSSWKHPFLLRKAVLSPWLQIYKKAILLSDFPWKQQSVCHPDTHRRHYSENQRAAPLTSQVTATPSVCLNPAEMG